MHLYNLTPEALTVALAALAAILLLATFVLVGKFRRLKTATDDLTPTVWTTYYGLDGQPFEAEVTELP